VLCCVCGCVCLFLFCLSLSVSLCFVCVCLSLSLSLFRFVKGKLIGGCDIIKQMHEDEELVDMFPKQCLPTPTPTNPKPKVTHTQTQTQTQTQAKPQNSDTTDMKRSQLNARLGKLINSSPVMLFMKGTQAAPRCKFSKQVVHILKNEVKVAFGSFDILSDQTVRSGLKAYSNWPTFPQLYVFIVILFVFLCVLFYWKIVVLNCHTRTHTHMHTHTHTRTHTFTHTT